ncbi:amidohydrolase family protein [Stakelama tenebrarum]|uniref:Amidohydrolase family protein n=1 Tax=Stakelama tenebrarum TaxID=2711215 RepID=A0A6G6Y3G7_9SPHN|nr:amidohydrolase family protein [Sphingosinithalassobacter tenebrarum]QIG79391.1 amidohydrolase family protein [Sphingosinithalassobacter tenebrarum]
MSKPLFLFLIAALLPVSAASAQHAGPGEGLPLEPARTIAFTTDEATWMAPDMAPDGGTILFDLLGDIYALDPAGGTARPVLTGMAFEFQPVFSPDGSRFAFVSDRSGSNNIWVANADGSGLTQLSHDSGATVFSSPAWSPDGRHVYASRMVHKVLAFELYRYNVTGRGEPEQITKAQPNGEGWDDRHNAMGAVASPDSRYVYYASKAGTTWSDKPLPHWQIVRRDLESGEEQPVVTAPGGAMHPALSHDGRMLVYASRRGGETGLRLRNLQTGEDKWIAFPIDHDGQHGGYYADLTPRFSFTPDDMALLVPVDGHLKRLELVDGSVADIPFSVDVELGLGPQTRVEQRVETGPVRVRVIQTPRQSPDGGTLVFSALGSLYRMALTPGSVPEKIDTAGLLAYQPSWSPDGASILFVSWTAKDGGQVWRIPAAGGAPDALARAGAYYTDPVFAPDGQHVAVMRASQTDRRNAQTEIGLSLPTDLLIISTIDGSVRRVFSQSGIRQPQFSPDGGHIRFRAPDGIKSVALGGGAPEPRVAIVSKSGNQYVGAHPPVAEIKLSPDGRWALASDAWQLYLVPVPEDADTPVDLDDPDARYTLLTDIGADDFAWADDGATITWSLGATYHRVALDQVDQAGAAHAEGVAETFVAQVEVSRDVPEGSVVLRGGTAITMQGDAVIENADVVVTGNRIVAVGPRGSIAIPAGAAIRDVRGKYLLPGFVDVHDHWFDIRRGILERNDWDFLATLAYGVTSGLDPQTFTTDIFAYQDMIDAGMMPGPRAFSTGPGVFVNADVDSAAHARSVLTRNRDYYRTRNVKSYMVGGRRERQIMIAASAQLGMMPTTEGASDLYLNLTHAIDGFAGNEHSLPIAPIHDDVIQLFARSGTAYNPTLIVLYGAAEMEHEQMGLHDMLGDAKLRRFIPEPVLEAKARGHRATPDFDRGYPRFAQAALEIQRAGGLVGIGAHGELPGLGYYWEMEALASGGGAPREVLRAATIDGARIIGRASDIGSIEAGKLADILILDADPLADIANVRALEEVMKNGRIYDAATLDEVYPRERALPPLWFTRPMPDVPALASGEGGE